MPPTVSQTTLVYTVQGLQAMKQATVVAQQLATAQKQLYASMQILAKGPKFTEIFWSNGKKISQTYQEVNGKMQLIASSIDHTARQQQNLNRHTYNYLTSWRFLSRLVAASLISRTLGATIRAISEGTKEAREFGIAIAEIQTISQNLPQSFGAWSKQILALSGTFARAPADVAEGLYQTLSDQVAEGANSIQFMNEAMRLSVITASTTADAVQSLTGAINAYGFTTADAGRLSDEFFKIVELGRVRLDELSTTYGRVLVLGQQLKIPFEDLGGAMAHLSISGIKASEAETWLRNVMLKLIRPTERMAEIFKEWGVASGQSAIETWGLVGVMSKLRDEAAKGDDEFAELGEMFNRMRALTGAAGLLNNFQRLKDDIKEISNAGDSANKAFEIMSNTLEYKLNQEIQKTLNFFLELGQALNRSLYESGEMVGGLSNAIKVLVINMIELTKLTTLYIGLSFAASLTSATTAASGFSKVLALINVRLGLIAAAAYAGYRIGQYFSSKTAAQVASDHEEALNAQIAAASDAAAKENRIISERAENYRNLARDMKSVYLQAIAAQESALNRLKKAEEDRLTLQDMLFDVQEALASDSQKMALYQERLAESLLKFKEYMKIGDTEKAADMLKELLSVQSRMQSIGQAAGRSYGEGFSEGIREGLTSTSGPAGIDESKYITYSRQVSTSKQPKRFSETIQAANILKQALKELNTEYKRITPAEMQQLDILEKIVKERQRQFDELNAAVERHGAALQNVTDIGRNALNESVASFNVIKGYFDRKAFWKSPFDKDNILIRSYFDELKKLLEEASKENFEYTENWAHNLIFELENLKGKLAEKYKFSEAELAEIKNFETAVRSLKEILAQKAEYTKIISDMQAASVKAANNLAELNTKFDTIAQTASASGTLIKDNLKFIADSFAQTNQSLLSIYNTLPDALRRADALLKKYEAVKAAKEAAREWVGGYMSRFAGGGHVGSDTINAMLSPGEFVTNARAARRHLPQLTAINSNAARFDTGGTVTNNNIGDINVSITGTGYVEPDGRRIASIIRREIRRGTVRGLS